MAHGMMQVDKTFFSAFYDGRDVSYFGRTNTSKHSVIILQNSWRDLYFVAKHLN